MGAHLCLWLRSQLLSSLQKIDQSYDTNPRNFHNYVAAKRYCLKTAVKTTKEGIVINIYVQPGASKSNWAGEFNGSLKLRVAAQPLEGAANKEVRVFLAKFFGVPKSAVEIIHGTKGRSKLAKIIGEPASLLEKVKAL